MEPDPIPSTAAPGKAPSSREPSAAEAASPPRRTSPADMVRFAKHLWSSEVNRAAVDRLAPENGEHLLDLGAGLGPASFHAAARVGALGSVTAIDPSRFMRAVMFARRPFRSNRRRIRIRDAVAEALPVADRSIDAVVGLNVVHLLADPESSASELARVVRPGGRILFVEEDIDDPGHVFHQPTPHSPDGPGLDELVTALERGGFDVETAHHTHFGGQPVNTITAATGR